MQETTPTPLSRAAFQILIAVASGPKHGYAVMKEVEAATSGEVRLNPGTLYTTIKRLLEEELIRETGKPAATSDHDDRRRYYAITASGRRAARAELARLRDVLDHATSRLCEKP